MTLAGTIDGEFCQYGEELGAMRLSEPQMTLLRYLYERFPTPYRDTGKTVTPRARYQPPSRREALDTLGIEPATWEDSIAFLTAHELIREVYRHGTKEYSYGILLITNH